MKMIHNTKTGMVYKLLRTAKDTQGEMLEMEVSYRPDSEEPPAHYHPFQTEHFKVLSGEMTVRVEGQIRVLKAGEQLEVPPQTIHSMWNTSEKPTLMHWVIVPALNSEQFFETLADLANAGKTNEKGVPNLFQIALTMPRFYGVFRMAKPAFWIQKMVFSLLAPVARPLDSFTRHHFEVKKVTLQNQDK